MHRSIPATGQSPSRRQRLHRSAAAPWRRAAASRRSSAASPGSGPSCTRRRHRAVSQAHRWIAGSHRLPDRDAARHRRAEIAIEMARWEASVQREDGAFCGAGRRAVYVRHGAGRARVPRGAGRHADGRTAPPPGVRFRRVPDSGGWSRGNSIVRPVAVRRRQDVYRVREPLRAAAADGCGRAPPSPALYGRRNEALAYYKRQPDLVEFKPELGTLSHIFGYMMEALTELGEEDLADAASQPPRPSRRQTVPSRPILARLDLFHRDGATRDRLVPAWRSSPRRRRHELPENLAAAERGILWQLWSGGGILPHEEISWAVKFFIDGLQLQAASSTGA